MNALLNGLMGGSMIGLAAATLLLFNGDILGASGIVSTAVLEPFKTLKDYCQHWKFVFIASFLLASHLLFAPSFNREDPVLKSLSPFAFAMGGLLVGFGTALGSGCTSGHGICGLARFSRRSFVAVMTFMLSAMLTVYLTSSPALTRWTQYFQTDDASSSSTEYYANVAKYLSMAVVNVAMIAPFFHDVRNEKGAAKLAPAAVAGFLFSTGLYVGQMVYSSRVLGFLDVSAIPKGTWDPTLMMVMGGGLVVSWLSYQYVDGFQVLKNCETLEHPIAMGPGAKFSVPNSTAIDSQLVLGAITFGVGWAICGICPGPAIFLAAAGVPLVLTHWWPAFFVGSFVAKQIKSSKSLVES